MRREFGVLLLLILSVPLLAFSQERGLPDALPPQTERADGREAAPARPMVQGGMFRRLRELPPYEQRRFMATDPEFQSFGPARKQMIRERLRQWNSMTPEEKDRVRQREEIVASLSPDQRREARFLLPQWRDLPPERRQALTVAFRHLRDLPPGERQAFLNTREVSEQFSPHEREILQGLSDLLPKTRGAAPADDPNE
jgi:hypothetical protein